MIEVVELHRVGVHWFRRWRTRSASAFAGRTIPVLPLSRPLPGSFHPRLLPFGGLSRVLATASQLLRCRLVLRVFALADVILLGAAGAPAVPAAAAQLRPSLGLGDDAHAGLLGFIGMLADLAALHGGGRTYL